MAAGTDGDRGAACNPQGLPFTALSLRVPAVDGGGRGRRGCSDTGAAAAGGLATCVKGVCAPRDGPVDRALCACGDEWWWHASAPRAFERHAAGGFIGRRVDRRAGRRHWLPPSATGAPAAAAAGVSGSQRSRGESNGPSEGGPQRCGGDGSSTAAARCARAPTKGAAGERVRCV